MLSSLTDFQGVPFNSLAINDGYPFGVAFENMRPMTLVVVSFEKTADRTILVTDSMIRKSSHFHLGFDIETHERITFDQTQIRRIVIEPEQATRCLKSAIVSA